MLYVGKDQMVGKRHKKIYRDNISAINKPGIHRLAKDQKIDRVQGWKALEITRGVTQSYLTRLLKKATRVAKKDKRKTIRKEDVEEAFAKM
jgi:histone H3/H4